MFEPGEIYAFTPPKHQNVNCKGCGADIWYVAYGRLMKYKGLENGMYIFEILSPYLCPSCGKTFLFHEELAVMNVTQEFEDLRLKPH